MPLEDHGVVADDIRKELTRVLASSTFGNSERHKRFLAFVIEETLAGRADRIKAYTIATSVFGRSENFDPQQDSIVRIEAGRLRRQLDHYYLTEGSDNAIRIVIPKGCYVPEFVAASGSEETARPKPRQPQDRRLRRGPRVLVAPFEYEAAVCDYPGFASGFTRQIIMGLTRFSNLYVYGADTALSSHGAHGQAELAERTPFDFVLTGFIAINAHQLTVDLLLQESPGGRYVWTERFERDLVPSEVQRLRNEIAAAVAQTLAQPYGILFSRSLDHEGEAPKRLGSYQAVLDYYQLIRHYNISSFNEVLKGLEQAIEQDPFYSEAFSCLSMLKTDSVRFGLVSERARTIEEGLSLARRAIELAPSSSSAYHALALAMWFSGDVEGSLATYRSALSLNPLDTEIMADLALRYAMRMDWERSLPLSEEAFQRNPCQTTAHHMSLFLFHYANRRFSEALNEARQMSAPALIYIYVARAAAAAELGSIDEARFCVAEIERIAPDYGCFLHDDLRFRNLHPVLVTDLAASLRRAGLKDRTFKSDPFKTEPLIRSSC